MMKILLFIPIALMTTGAFASEDLIMKTVEVEFEQSERIRKSSFPTERFSGSGPAAGGEIAGVVGGATGGLPDIFNTGATPLGRVGQVLSMAGAAVVLGESTYTLVQHGKPSNTTEFAPISVVPIDPISKEIVNPFDMENCSMPSHRKFVTTMTTLGLEVVRFEYMVIFVFNCSYEGVGKYIQTAIIQPVSVKANYGWDFNATMKLSGIMNHGKKADPIVGALLTIKYTMNSWRTAFERNDTVHVSGAGGLKTYSQ